MNNRIIISILSVVLIVAVLSGCVQETSEIEIPGGASQPNVTPPPATPDAAQTAPTSEWISSFPAPPMITNWKYVSYRNQSISNAPALNKTARITYSIIPDRDIEILLVYLDIPDGFELIDDEGRGDRTLGNTTYLDTIDVKWFPTNLSKGTVYQFNVTIKAVKTGNWTIHAYRSKKEIYISVFEDSAYWYMSRPAPLIDIETARGYCINKSERPIVPIESLLCHHFWNGTAWIKVESPPKSMVRPDWNGTAWVERKNQS